MRGIELVEPSVERCHSEATIELSRHRSLRQRGDVQLGAPSQVVEIVGKADVAAGHTHRIHTAKIGRADVSDPAQRDRRSRRRGRQDHRRRLPRRVRRRARRHRRGRRGSARAECGSAAAARDAESVHGDRKRSRGAARRRLLRHRGEPRRAADVGGTRRPDRGVACHRGVGAGPRRRAGRSR